MSIHPRGILVMLGIGDNTKTAYTRDGVNFVSSQQVDENVKR